MGNSACRHPLQPETQNAAEASDISRASAAAEPATVAAFQRQVSATTEPATVDEFQRQVSAATTEPPTVDEFQRQVSATEGVEVATVGDEGTSSFRLKFQERGVGISPWHDIPLRTAQEGIFRMLVEIPKMSRSKMEVSTKEEGNPIAQDIKNDKLREYHGPIYWNYGMFPQTWEDPTREHPELKVVGDNDPLDVVEIGSQVLAFGTIAKVKVLGVLAMIDDGELDWKVIAIHQDDPLSKELNDIHDVEKKCPGVVSGIREWLRWYKTPDGKPLNSFGFEERALDRAHALDVISETHEAWKKLVDGETETNKLWVSTYGQMEDGLLGA